MKNRSSISLFTTVLLGLAAISAPAWGAAYDAGGTAGRVSLYMTKTSCCIITKQGDMLNKNFANIF